MRLFVKGQVKIFICILLFLCLCLLLDDVFRCYTCNESDDSLSKDNKPKPTQVPNYLRITKSLSELRKMRETNEHVLIFNHAPRTGSELFVLILKWLQGKNNFKHVSLSNLNRRPLDEEQQKDLSGQVTNYIKEMAVPISFDLATYFIDFSKFDWHSPTYFNVIRDPADLIMSRLHENMKIINNSVEYENGMYVKTLINKVNYDMAIPYFCGHHPNCLKLNNRWALTKAMENVERFYPVVGVLQYLEETLYVTENKLKYYFQGASEIYRKRFKEAYDAWKSKNIRKNNDKRYEDIKKTLSTEFEFYNWIRMRLLDQNKHYLLQEEMQKSSTKQIFDFQIEQPLN